MTATKDVIRQWLKDAPAGSTHMVVAADTWDVDWEYYPVYVEAGIQAALEKIGIDPNAKVVEVYDLSKQVEPQLEERRAWNL